MVAGRRCKFLRKLGKKAKPSRHAGVLCKLSLELGVKESPPPRCHPLLLGFAALSEGQIWRD